MGWGHRGIAALASMLCALVGVATAIAPRVAYAVPKAPPVASPLPGWVVDRVRFDPLGSAPLGVEGLGSYRGSLEMAGAGAGVGVIDTLALDDYLRGISEVPTAWPIEAQKAQAIAARTYALHEMALRTNTAYKALGADICATDACQVYAGLAKEQRPGSEAWSAAVEATKGQVLWYRDAPIKAMYSSSNGGRSVAGDEPYLRAVDDPDDAQSPLHQWRVTLALADVVRVLGLAGEPRDVHREGDDVVASAQPPINGDEAMPAPAPVELRLPAGDFRARMNGAFPTPAGLPTPLPSQRFDVGTYEGGQVVIDGRGWGHGIGLSQYGALGKALRGVAAADILAAYYAGLRPVTLPPQALPKTVKVAVDLGRSDATVTDPGGRFRVTDVATGTTLAVAAVGSWQVVPAANGKVRVVPPPEETGPATGALGATEPAVPVPGQPLRITVHLDGPTAFTRVELAPPGRDESVEVAPRTLRHSGDLVVAISGLAQRGVYRLRVDRDAGGGRAATSTIDVPVGPVAVPRDTVTPAAAPISVSPTSARPPRAVGSPRARWAYQLLAAVAALAAALGAARVGGVGRSLRRPLH